MPSRYLEIARKVLGSTKVDQPRGEQGSNKPKLRPSGSLETGSWIEFESPLFGRCHGRIAIVHDEYEWLLVADHSATKDFAFVSKHWDVQVQVSPS